MQAEAAAKLDRFFDASSVGVLHKAGWLPNARHDNGVVAFSAGAFVACVMTWRTRTADELTGRVALTAFQRFAGR